jgi:hypothetical protein
VFEGISKASPFASLAEARSELERVMRLVEDEFSGIPENPNADNTTESDGRMYPPSDKYEVRQKCPSVRTFRQLAHKTSFGNNGAILIETLDGVAVLNLAGKDGREISDLLRENLDEANREGKSGQEGNGASSQRISRGQG